MKKVGSYLLLIILGVIGLLSALRAVELLIFGGLSASNAGRVTGSALLAILFLWGAAKVFKKARAV